MTIERYPLTGEWYNDINAVEAIDQVSSMPVSSVQVVSTCPKMYLSCPGLGPAPPYQIARIRLVDGATLLPVTAYSIYRLTGTAIRYGHDIGNDSMWENTPTSYYYNGFFLLGASMAHNCLPSTTSTYTRFAVIDDQDPYAMDIWRCDQGAELIQNTGVPNARFVALYTLWLQYGTKYYPARILTIMPVQSL